MKPTRRQILKSLAALPFVPSLSWASDESIILGEKTLERDPKKLSALDRRKLRGILIQQHFFCFGQKFVPRRFLTRFQGH